MDTFDFSKHILSKHEYYAIHYNDYKDADLHDYQIKLRLNKDWRQYLREQFNLYDMSDDYIYSCYRRWYARDRARMLKLCNKDSALLKQKMGERRLALFKFYESKGYELHDCTDPNYKKNRETIIKKSLERYDDNLYQIRSKLRNKYKSESGIKRIYGRR